MLVDLEVTGSSSGLDMMMVQGEESREGPVGLNLYVLAPRGVRRSPMTSWFGCALVPIDLAESIECMGGPGWHKVTHEVSQRFAKKKVDGVRDRRLRAQMPILQLSDPVWARPRP